jgi:hypothetical protein
VTKLFVDFFTATFRPSLKRDHPIIETLNYYPAFLEKEYGTKKNLRFYQQRFRSSIYRYHVDIPLGEPDSNKLLTIGYQCKDASKSPYWLAFNPSNMTAQHFLDIEYHLTQIFTKDYIREIYAHATVTRLDLAIDLPGVLPHYLLVNAKDLRCGQINTNSEGLVESMHIGARRSPLFVNAYRKSPPGAARPLTRLECRLKRFQGTPEYPPTIGNLQAILHNPFERITMYRIPDDRTDRRLLNVVLAAARTQGLKPTLQLFPLRARRRAESALAEYRVNLFSAKTLWAQLPEALSVLSHLDYRRHC